MNYLLQYAYDDAPNQWETFSFYADVDRAMRDYNTRRAYDAEHGIVRTWKVEFKVPTGTVAEMLEFKKDWNTGIWNQKI